MKSALKENISPFPQWLTSKHVALTLGELEIAHLVKEGRRSKDIAQVLNLSDKTIEDYRKQRRTNLGIRKNKRINLKTYLLILQTRIATKNWGDYTPVNPTENPGLLR